MSGSDDCGCGCCEGPDVAPARDNRPGLPSVPFRVGKYDSFLRRMLSALATSLPDLSTRDPSDPSIALLDSWAVVADVLTFYQERIANEGFLRTAVERRSILELARTIGYELKPGVAALAYLTFTVDESPGAPPSAVIGPRTRIQSLPAGGKLPQTFETDDSSFTARPEWNTLRPQLTREQKLVLSAAGDKLLLETDGTTVAVTRIYVSGTTTGISVGDPLLFVLEAPSGSPPKPPPLIQTVTAVATDTANNRTQIDLNDSASDPSPPSAPSAPLPLITLTTNEMFSAYNIQATVTKQSWREQDLKAYTFYARWPTQELIQYINTASPKPVSLPTADGVFAFGERMGFFGNAAPRWDQLPVSANTRGSATNYYHNDWDGTGGADAVPPTIWQDSTTSAVPVGTVYLERTVRNISPNSWAIFADPTLASGSDRTAYRVVKAFDASRADFALSGRVTALWVENPDSSTVDTTAKFMFRTATAHVRSQNLTLAPLPITDPIGAGLTTPADILTLDTMVLGLTVGQAIVISGMRKDLAGVTATEVAILKDIVHADSHTTLYFTADLQFQYDRPTVTISANVVSATNGQTVADEVLGSGDASVTNQKFILKKPPLTYVTASTPSGAASTMTLRVNGIAWTEEPSLYGLSPSAQGFTIRTDDNGTARITGGDGVMGGRFPTGAENVRATYRSGIGLAGQVDANSLTLLQARPPGVRTVTNPLPAYGAADPEARDAARQNAPLTVVTMDRIVSLDDYGDFARGFAGIGKAQAIRVTDGQSDVIVITVASASGDPLPASSHTLGDLQDAIANHRDPGGPTVVLLSFEQFYFNITADIIVTPAYDGNAVIDAATAAVRAAFAFDQRDFGQSVSAAEIVRTIQAVPGVDAVFLHGLWRPTIDPTPTAGSTPPLVLLSQSGRLVTTGYAAAQLVLINPVGITINPALAPVST